MGLTEDSTETEVLAYYARVDWLYSKPWRTLHALGEGDADADLWALTGVTYACGKAPKDGIAHIPGIFTRMSAPRCNECCDATGLPRGKGSPKNDFACRVLLGLATEEPS